MKKFKYLMATILIMSIFLMGNVFSTAVFADSQAEYVLLTEELYESYIKGNQNITPIPYNTCYPITSNYGIALLSNNETGTCYHPAYVDATTGQVYYFEMTHYIREITTPNGNIVEVNEHTSELPTWFIDAYSNYANDLEISATKTDEPTIYYNCHSYAWYWDNSNNTYWMNEPDMYYSSIDQSYVEVQNPRKGDIICYYFSNNTSIMYNLHSGIVVDVVANSSGSLDSVLVESKWGMLGRYTHRGDQCPYVPEFGGEANVIKFYRPRVESAHQLNSEMDDLSLAKSVSGNNGIQNTYSMYELNIGSTGYYEFTVSSDSDMNIVLYDDRMQQYCTLNYTEYSNIYTFALNLTSGRYYLRSEYTDSNHSGTISVGIKYHVDHVYNYTSVDTTYHIGECVHCGHETGNTLHKWRDYSHTHMVCEDCNQLKRRPTEGFIPIIKGITPDTETE